MLAAKNAQTALQSGVTSIIGSSNGDYLDQCLKDAIILGLVEGPRVRACTREFMTSGDAADGRNRSWYMDLGQSGMTCIADGVDQVRQVVREAFGRGCYIAKFSVSPGHGSEPAREVAYYTQAELDVAAATAHELGGKVRAHCAAKKGIMMCAKAGFDIIDHADRIDEAGIEAVLQADAAITPSLLWTSRFLQFAESWDHSTSPFPIGSGFPETLEDTMARLAGVREDFEYTCTMVPKMNDAGVRLLVGDDFGFPMMPHGDYVSEYEVYVKQLNIPALDVIRWATRHGGEAMGMGDELGTIHQGKLADLLVVDGDPATDISCLRDRITGIMLDGAFVRDPAAA
jgi:imidazolonepropionase-like amidohydrolase